MSHFLHDWFFFSLYLDLDQKPLYYCNRYSSMSFGIHLLVHYIFEYCVIVVYGGNRGSIFTGIQHFFFHGGRAECGIFRNIFSWNFSKFLSEIFIQLWNVFSEIFFNFEIFFPKIFLGLKLFSKIFFFNFQIFFFRKCFLTL